MKVPSPTTIATVASENPSSTLPARVCIHVVNEAHNDVRVMRAATTLAEAGFQVTVVDITTKRSLPKQEEQQGFHLKHVIVPSWYTSRRFEPWFFLKAVQTLLLSTFQLLQTRTDVYHASELTALPACCLAALLRRKPLIFEIYDLHFPVPETCIGFWRRSAKLLTLFYRLVLPHCAGVLATSPLHIQAIRDHFHLKETAISLVRNVPHYQSHFKSDRLRQRLGLGPEVRIALYQGTIQPDRGLDKLVLAAPFLEKNIVIVIKGAGRGSTLPGWAALIESEGVADRVKIMPPVPAAEYLDWTASADIGLIVHPPDYSLNTRTLLPNKLFEYLMAGLPVLSSSLDAVSEVIQTYDVGQVLSSLTPIDIARAINAMLTDQRTYSHMRRNTFLAAKECCWEQEQQKLIRFYHDILANKLSMQTKKHSLRRCDMQQSLIARLKHALPPELLNTLLLQFPFLYRTKLVFYETNLRGGGGIIELLEQVTTILGIEGDIIECGSSRCGASIIMAHFLRAQRASKKIFACDSFEGFDLAELERELHAGLTTATSKSFTSTSYRYVQKKIAALRLKDTVIPIKGYFQDSLPTLSGPFCLALIDCDLKDSLLYAAETIWPKLSGGGRILFDDYLNAEFQGAKQGVDIFVEKHRSEISEHGLLNRLYYICKAE